MPKKWDDVKEEIRILYKTENKTLLEVMRLMKGCRTVRSSMQIKNENSVVLQEALEPLYI